MIHWQPVGPHFFETLRIPLVGGRVWSDTEQANAAHITVVNQAMADQFWPQGDAVGQRIRFLIPAIARGAFCPGGSVQSDGWFVVIGVTGNTRNDGIAKPITAAAYVPETLMRYPVARLAVRTIGSPLHAVQTVRERVNAAVPRQGGTRVRTLEQLLRSEGWGKEELVASVFLVFGALALLLAAVGLYSALSYTVVQRRREFGVRMALGASRKDIVLGVLRSALITVTAGLLVGLLINGAASAGLERRLQISVTDPIVLAVTAALLVGVSAAAAAFPAWRSVSIDPSRALRVD